ncbi:MAG: hypothetical protein QOJ44_495, partial [Acidimicrobiaceae bacterium]|nr:hypothetical protein [Acidimicrobiaceae bacterium]
AATASAADEPKPRAMGISDRTVMARWSCPATSMATRAARWEGSSESPAPSPSERTISREAGSTSTSTYRSRATARVSNPGPRLAEEAGARARTLVRVVVTDRSRRDQADPSPVVRSSEPRVAARKGGRQIRVNRHHRVGVGTDPVGRKGTTRRWGPTVKTTRPTEVSEVAAVATGRSITVVATA